MEPALIVSVVGLAIAIAAAAYARRNAVAAEDSAASARRSTAAAERAASSAERSEEFAKRSALAEETAAQAALAAEARAAERAVHEQAERRRARMPLFEPIRDMQSGTFNFKTGEGVLNAHLRNVGGSEAKVESATLHHVHGPTDGLVQLHERSPRQEEPAVTCRVPQDGIIVVRFTTGEELVHDTQPLRLELVYTSTDETDRAICTIMLLRTGTSAGQRPQWRADETNVRFLD